MAAGLVWLDARHVLVQRRGRGARFGAGCWELPGGKLEAGERPREALARELREEWGPGAGALVVGPVAGVCEHRYPPPGPWVRVHVLHVLPPRGLGDPGWAGASWRGRLRPAPDHEPAAREVSALLPAEFLAADRELIARVRDGRLGPPGP